jgi:hypothetical protein
VKLITLRLDAIPKIPLLQLSKFLKKNVYLAAGHIKTNIVMSTTSPKPNLVIRRDAKKEIVEALQAVCDSLKGSNSLLLRQCQSALKKALALSFAVSLSACSSMVKETYTETREFNYPKGVTPHLKDMYMHKSPPPQASNNDVVDFAQPVAELQDELPRSLEEIKAENRLLAAMHVNKMLREQ